MAESPAPDPAPPDDDDFEGDTTETNSDEEKQTFCDKQTYNSMDEATTAFKMFTQEGHVIFKTTTSNSRQKVFKCKDPTCPWQVNLFQSNPASQCGVHIKGEHNHAMAVKPKTMDKKTLAELINKIYSEAGPATPIKTLKTLLKTKHRLDVSSNQLRRAIKLHGEIYGDPVRGFPFVEAYVKRITPGDSDVGVVDTKEGVLGDQAVRRFHRLFVCLSVCIAAFACCRPVLGLDACHMKTIEQGVLLLVMSLTRWPLRQIAYEIFQRNRQFIRKRNSIQERRLSSTESFYPCIHDELARLQKEGLNISQQIVGSGPPSRCLYWPVRIITL